MGAPSRPASGGLATNTLSGYLNEPPWGIILMTMSEMTTSGEAVRTAAECCHDPECEHHYGYLNSKDNYLKRLRRIEGQVQGLQKMVAEEKYCIDILTQVSAATKALQSVALALLDEHMSTCVVRAARAGGDEAEVKLAEASDAIARLVRS